MLALTISASVAFLAAMATLGLLSFPGVRGTPVSDGFDGNAVAALTAIAEAAVPDCVDCGLFYRTPGPTGCTRWIEDCGDCVPGYAAQQATGGRHEYICERVRGPTGAPTSAAARQVSPTSTRSSNLANMSRESSNPQNMTKMVAGGMSLVTGLVILAVFLLLAVSSFSVVMSYKFTHRTFPRAADAGEAGTRLRDDADVSDDEGDVGRTDRNARAGAAARLQENAADVWVPGATSFGDVGEFGVGRATSIPASSAYSSMATLDMPMLNSSMVGIPAVVAPLAPPPQAMSRVAIESSTLLGAASSTPEIYRQHQQTAQRGRTDHSEDGSEASINFSVTGSGNTAASRLPRADPVYPGEAHMSLFGLDHSGDQSILRDAAPMVPGVYSNPSHINVPPPHGLSLFDEPRDPLSDLHNDSAESVLLVGPFSRLGDDTRDDDEDDDEVVSWAETDPSDWAPQGSANANGFRSQRMSETSDVLFGDAVDSAADRLASTRLDANDDDDDVENNLNRAAASNGTDAPPRTPRPFHLAPSPNYDAGGAEDDSSSSSSSSDGTPTTTSDNNDNSGRRRHRRNDATATSSASSSSSSSASSSTAGSDTSDQAGGSGARRRRCSETEEEYLVKTSIKISIKRSRLEEEGY